MLQEPPSKRLLGTIGFEAIDEIDGIEEAGSRPRADAASCDGDRQMRLACAGSAADDDIALQADYVLALKGNQGALRQDVELFIAEQKARASRIRRSAGTKRLTAVTAASRLEPPPSSTALAGCGSATPGPV